MATDFACSRRFGLKSILSMEAETSIANTKSMPSLVMSSTLFEDWGLAIAMARTAIANVLSAYGDSAIQPIDTS